MPKNRPYRDPADVPLGDGLAEDAKKHLRNRDRMIERTLERSVGGKKSQKGRKKRKDDD